MNFESINKWKTEGYCVVDNLIDSVFLDKLIYTLNTIPFGDKLYEFGSENGFLEFPTSYDELNEITLYPKIIQYCQTLLGTDDIRLIQSDFWSKKNYPNGPENSNSDQRIHMDYPNNYLVPPPDWDKPESVAIIIYYSDSDKCGGNTYLVPRMGQTDVAYLKPYDKLCGLGKYHWFNDKTITENYFKKNYPDVYQFRKTLYDREIPIRYKKGSVLFYRHDIWHRGSPVNIGQRRIVQNLGFKKSGCDWITIWNQGWSRTLCSTDDKMERFIRNANNIQRKCLGIPDINSRFWNKENKKCMSSRYQSKL